MSLRASVPLHLLVKWLKREELSKIRKVENAKRQRVSDAHKLIELYKIGVKYEKERVLESIQIIEEWLEMRQRESMSVVKGLEKIESKKKKEEEETKAKDKEKKKKKMTSREIKLNSINEGGGHGGHGNDEDDGDEDDWGSVEDSKMSPSDALVPVPAVPETDDDNEQQSENPQDDMENPSSLSLAIKETESMIELPSFCSWSVDDILGASEETTYMDKEPLLLRHGHEYQLVQFLLENLQVFVGTKRGFKVFYNKKHVLMFEHNVQDMVKVLSAEKLQGLWRMRKARQVRASKTN